ncbi:unnamed protein product [Eretmochelys imbricata]
MQPPALAALTLLASLQLLEVRGEGTAGSQVPSPAPRDQPPRPGRPVPAGPQPPRLEKRSRTLARRGQRAPKAASPHVCGVTCCPGWSLAPKTQKCTKAICTPKCRNGGLCREPQVCTCRPGFAGRWCEQLVPPEPALGLPPGPSPRPTSASAPRPTAPNARRAASVHWQPLTLAELQAVLRRRAAGPTDKMASVLAKHLEAQRGRAARPTPPPSTRPPKSGQTLHRSPRPVLCPLLCQNGGSASRRTSVSAPPASPASSARSRPPGPGPGPSAGGRQPRGAAAPHQIRLHPAPRQPPAGAGRCPVHGERPRAAPPRGLGDHPPGGAGE